MNFVDDGKENYNANNNNNINYHELENQRLKQLNEQLLNEISAIKKRNTVQRVHNNSSIKRR